MRARAVQDSSEHRSPQPACRPLRTAVIVEREPQVRDRLRDALLQHGVTATHCAATAEQGLRLLDDKVDLVLCDPCLDDGAGMMLLQTAAQAVPAPRLVAVIHEAPCALVFTLSRHGVSATLPAAFDSAEVAHALGDLIVEDTALTRVARAHVGAIGVKQLVTQVRDAMFDEALSRTGGNRHAAARLLGVDRKRVQAMAERLGHPER